MDNPARRSGDSMADTPTSNDRFARGAATGGRGLGAGTDHFRKDAAPRSGDPFKSAGRPPSKLARTKPAADPLARGLKSAEPLPQHAAKPAPKTPMTAPMKNPFARAPLHPPKTRTVPPAADPKPAPVKTSAARAAPIAAAASWHNPFGRAAAPKSANTPVHVESSRTPLHVVTAPPEQADPPRQRGAVRSSSLVLVSGAGAVAAAETLEAPPIAEKAPDPPPAADPPAVATTPTPETRKGGGGGSKGGEPPKSGGGAVAASVKRGFNQDDLFGVVFGVGVLIFLLLWLMRGKGEDTQIDDGLVGIQSAANTQAVAAPAPRVDPFGNAPVDLRPTGPIPDPLPEPDVAAQSAAPAPPPAAAAAAPPVAVAPPVAIRAPAAAAAAPAVPLAERKMNGWFCTASSALTDASRAALEDELATFADVFAGKELVVRGYADTRGSSDYNVILGGERARVVADFLRMKGLTVAESTGVGELDGLDDNQNCPNQRRVDVWVKDGPAAAPSRECKPEPDAAKLVCS
jgi:outer membrane protein OmpA-like peptidoglycan-associated protein